MIKDCLAGFWIGLILGIFLLISSGWALAAPIPATSSSSLISSDLGLYLSEHGFKIHAGGTAWIQAPPPKGIASLVALYKSPEIRDGVQASLTVRMDQLKQTTTLSRYVKQWLKDYSRLGFDILESKSVKVAGQDAYLVDVLSQATSKQLRQVIMIKDTRAVVMTCRDHRTRFADTVRTCNDIVRNFSWTR